MNNRLPFVDYLDLGEPPCLRAHECRGCGALYFDRRNGCAACEATDFGTRRLSRRGTVASFTVVAVAAPGVEVPFVAALIDCDGVKVRANIVGCPPDPAHIRLGMPVELTTFSLGTDDAGTEAIGFGFTPLVERSAHV